MAFGAGILMACVLGYCLFRLARRLGVEAATRQMNEETEAKTKSDVERANQVHADRTTDSDDWL